MGAGLTHALWMKSGGVLVQMLPYGWEVHPGQLIRSCYSADIPLSLKGHYLQAGFPLCCVRRCLVIHDQLGTHARMT